MPDAWDEAASQYHGAPAAEAKPQTGNDDWKIWTQGAGGASSPQQGREYKDRSGNIHHAIPEGTEVMGSPILPGSQIIPAAIGTGVTKLGEHLGLPEWASLGAGALAGGGVQKGIASFAESPTAQRVGKAVVQGAPVIGKWVKTVGDAIEPKAPPTPFRPNPAVASKMPYGGPAPVEADAASYGGVGMGGAPEPPAAPGPAAPFKANPRIARRLGKGRSAEDYSTPAYGAPVRQSGTPALEQPAIKTPSASSNPAPPRYAGPNKVNPNIAKKLRFTPGAEDQYAGSAGDQPGATLGTRAEMMRQQRLKAQFLNNQKPPDPLDIADFLP